MPNNHKTQPDKPRTQVAPRKSGTPCEQRWYVYLLRCGSGALYTGITTDVSRRLEEHREGKGKGAKYLRGKEPLRLVFEKSVGTKSLALIVEGRIKKLSKARKEALIKKDGMIERMIAQAED